MLVGITRYLSYFTNLPRDWYAHRSPVNSKGWFPVSGILRAGPAGGIFQADFAAGGLMAMHSQRILQFIFRKMAATSNGKQLRRIILLYLLRRRIQRRKYFKSKWVRKLFVERKIKGEFWLLKTWNFTTMNTFSSRSE